MPDVFKLPTQDEIAAVVAGGVRRALRTPGIAAGQKALAPRA